MRLHSRIRHHQLASVALAALIGLSLAGCNKTTYMKAEGAPSGQTSLFGGSAGPAPEAEAHKEVRAAEERYRSNPKDPAAAVRLAEALRRNDQRAQALAVLQQAALHSPNHKPLLGAYGRALADTGSLDQAMEVLGRADTPDQPDWRILNAQGAVLDQMGRHEEARQYYTTALKIAPEQPSLLSNLGLSYALSRDLKQAEQVLRRAGVRGSADRRVRQNLALVVGLQGRFEEAEQIARADLPPNEAAENIAYLRQMLAQQQRGPARGKRTRAIDIPDTEG